MTDLSKSLLKLGTSSWSVDTWVGVFYPPGTSPSQYLSLYAQRYDCVEIDNTFYRTPSRGVVRKWRDDTPPGFLFTAKVPRVVTHEKVLQDCQKDLADFLRAMEPLREKLGPLLLQLPYFNKNAFASEDDFLTRLSLFLKELPRDWKWTLEIRNKWWIKRRLLDLLRENQVAFTLIDQSWMPRISQILKRNDPDTTDFIYIRWLGDRKGIEEITTSWDKVVVDRTADLQEWVTPVRNWLRKGRVIYGFFNNHYAGHAPASLELFRRLLE
jgi:uncharacterized protein YecE (DUF72 family)